MPRRRDDEPLLGEWACLAILSTGRAHGFAIARRLSTNGDVGRAWSLTRPMTYRSLEALTQRGFVESVAVEPGKAGGDRTVLSMTATGRAALRKWRRAPVTHLRDMRSTFLVKLIACDLARVDRRPLIDAQLEHFAPLADALARTAAAAPEDPVAAWRAESSASVIRYLKALPERSPAAS